MITIAIDQNRHIVITLTYQAEITARDQWQLKTARVNKIHYDLRPSVIYFIKS